MREEIWRRFVERSFSWWLYPYLDHDTSEAGEVGATRFCYVGAVAFGKERFRALNGYRACSEFLSRRTLKSFRTS